MEWRMNTNVGTAETPSMRARLSALWVFILFNMAFADIFSFTYPGSLKEVMTGYAGGVHVTPGFLLAAALVTEIPIAMVVLSRILRRGVNRWANIVAAVATIAYVIGGGSATPHYIFFAAIQVACALVVVRCAWKWREPDTSTIPAARVGVVG
jgi:uncharacterized membrane protein YhaH (DUF805 family)